MLLKESVHNRELKDIWFMFEKGRTIFRRMHKDCYVEGIKCCTCVL